MNGFDHMRVGIYGGTFAPVHNGHVAAAKAFMEQMKLDYLFIIPAHLPPHKQIDESDDPVYRLRMCELAFKDIDGVVISDCEIARGGKSYTYDTLKELQREDTRLFLLFVSFIDFSSQYRFLSLYQSHVQMQGFGRKKEKKLPSHHFVTGVWSMVLPYLWLVPWELWFRSLRLPWVS